MIGLKILFFAGMFIVFYSYAGYGILLAILLQFRKLTRKRQTPSPPRQDEHLPRVSILIAAYNEEHFITEKITNTLALDYPPDKLDIIFITDGSSDRTPELAGRYQKITLLHEPERKGKIAAIHRAMAFIQTPITIFSDANTLLNKECIRSIVRHYDDEKVGGVAGEKKVLVESSSRVAGEGIYWKYESLLKKLDSAFFTVVGAAGELFSIRTALYEYPGDNVLLDDFIISLGICRKGYRVAYEPAAFAAESPSSNLREEQKRKIRISAGAFQSMSMLSDLLNIFKYPKLSFQYISHRVLRWTLCPALLPLLLVANILILRWGGGLPYRLFLLAQLLFYAAACTGGLLSLRNIKLKLFYVPYYFLFLNISLYIGFFRYLRGKQSVLWDKATRERSVA